MLSTGKNREALEALRTFNTAMTTVRLYPPTAPQVSNSVEKAYKAIHSYLSNHGVLSFSHTEGPSLCGAPINQKTLGKIEGFEFFQQLEVLRLKHLVLTQGFEKSTLQKILTVFTTPHQRIKKEGGIQALLSSLELNQLFPEEYRVDSQPVEQNQLAVYLEQLRPEAKLYREYIDHLIGETTNVAHNVAIKDELKESDKAARLLTGLIAEVLKEVEKDEDAVVLPLFPIMLQGMEPLLYQEKVKETLLESALILGNRFQGNALSLILVQDYPKGFGEALLNRILTGISIESFGQVIDQLRRQEKSLAAQYGKSADRYKSINAKLTFLLSTPKGKLFVGQGKAKALLKSGEGERRTKRVQAALSSMLQGNLEILESDEIVESLPASIERLIANGRDDVAATIIEILAKQLVKEPESGEDRISRCMSAVGDSLIKLQKWGWLQNLSLPFISWIRDVEQVNETTENIVKILHGTMLHAWSVGKNVRADQILKVLFSLRTGKLQKSSEFQKMVAAVNDQSFDRAFLKKLLAQAYVESADESAKVRLSRQGTFTAQFLIEALLESKEINERLRLIEILADMGDILPPVLVKRLQDPMPWHGRRNLIKLIAETGNEKNVEEVIRYVNHDDLRIQKETFLCLYKISGERRKEVLLKVLAMTSEQVMVQAVKALAAFTDDDVAREMVSLLDNRNSFSQEVRSSVLVQVCQLLGHCSPNIAFEPLKEFQKTKGKGENRKLDERVWETVDDALSHLKSSMRTSIPSQQAKQNGAEDKVSITDFPEESEARYLFETGRKEKGLEVLIQLINKLARLRLFNQAKKLRDWLIEEEPTALEEIIKAAEIIEDEKNNIIEKDHLSVWSQLYDLFTPEEFNVFFYALTNKKYGTNETIIEQGNTEPCLYLINKGNVKLFYRSKGKEILVNTIGPGDILGLNSFFETSIPTINASSINRVELSRLDASRIPQWEADYPELFTKLREYCTKFQNLHDQIKTLGQDRRQGKRLPASGILLTTFFDQEGEKAHIKIKGELADISQGGVSFHLGLPQKTQAHFLLGRKVKVTLPISERKESVCTLIGNVVAVKMLQSIDNDYSLHVQFDQDLAVDIVQDIVRAGQKTE